MIIKPFGRIPPMAKLFLAEGASEEGFIQRVLDVCDDRQSLVYCFGGLSKLPLVLKSLSDVPGFDKLKCLGLMLDAETDFDARVASVRSQFANHGVSLPVDDVRNARIFQHGGCRIGIYISPGMGRAGRIEDIAMVEIQSSRLWPCISTYADCVTHEISSVFDTKSVVQTYIGSLRGGLCGLGRAFQANILDVAHAAYDIPRGIVEQLIA